MVNLLWVYFDLASFVITTAIRVGLGCLQACQPYPLKSNIILKNEIK